MSSRRRLLRSTVGELPGTALENRIREQEIATIPGGPVIGYWQMQRTYAEACHANCYKSDGKVRVAFAISLIDAVG